MAWAATVGWGVAAGAVVASDAVESDVGSGTAVAAAAVDAAVGATTASSVTAVVGTVAGISAGSVLSPHATSKSPNAIDSPRNTPVNFFIPALAVLQLARCALVMNAVQV